MSSYVLICIAENTRSPLQCEQFLFVHFLYPVNAITTLASMPPPDIHCKQVETLYSDHHRWLRGWLCKKLGYSEQAADLVHDTFLRILNSGEVLTGLTKPRAYLTSGLVGRLEKGDLHCEQSW
ncbi:sigma factor [Nitrosomonas europaea]|uniref:sigma factor n=1 Tax=Nitrosomonas europaea TaxID=915 RepID=UPI003265BEA0